MNSRLDIVWRGLAAVLAGAFVVAAQGQPVATTNAMIQVPGGLHRPLFLAPGDAREVAIKRFLLDERPVTNGEFLEFVRANARWRRSQVKRLFADESYLVHWAGDLDLGPDPTVPLQPVTRVSWFAAKAYCAWQNKRLPTSAEWEWAAHAGFTRADGESDPEFRQAVDRWYATPAPEALPRAGAGRTNFFGLRDLHGLVWEWTSDFNSSLVTGDARGDTGLDRQLFCGAGALGATERANYPAFMRYGFRSSLKADYTIHNLGFRCAKDP